MKSSTTALLALFTVLAIGYTGAYQANDLVESRNFLQQLLINQIVNVLPVNIRDKIDSTALQFGMVRHEFLLRCLKELQAFQAYSKIDFITAIQKTVKFAEENITSEHEEELRALEDEGIQLATLLFENKLRAGDLNPIYDLLVKVVRKQIDGPTLVVELPRVVRQILASHAQF
ncbi:unnamed protein product [Adineta ricciae]|uniref:Secreted protein n=1 Tax=Adineta ricciae TaxID=249248 RepID=A0A814YDU8_ADIRI|nr:unnamed protein product [Adineta ricciae]CAF1228474.1 unnamed protein product [Adineta ricciae]